MLDWPRPYGIGPSLTGVFFVEAIGNVFGIFHSLSVVVVVLLVAITLGACAMMVAVFRGDFDNTNSQF